MVGVVEVEIVPTPVPPAVVFIVMGEEPIAVNPVQDVLPEQVTDVVATFAKVFTPEKYGMLPMTAVVEVERPLNEIALVERTRGKLKVRGFS